MVHSNQSWYFDKNYNFWSICVIFLADFAAMVLSEKGVNFWGNISRFKNGTPISPDHCSYPLSHMSRRWNLENNWTHTFDDMLADKFSPRRPSF